MAKDAEVTIPSKEPVKEPVKDPVIEAFGIVGLSIFML